MYEWYKNIIASCLCCDGVIGTLVVSSETVDDGVPLPFYHIFNASFGHGGRSYDELMNYTAGEVFRGFEHAEKLEYIRSQPTYQIDLASIVIGWVGVCAFWKTVKCNTSSASSRLSEHSNPAFTMMNRLPTLRHGNSWLTACNYPLFASFFITVKNEFLIKQQFRWRHQPQNQTK